MKCGRCGETMEEGRVEVHGTAFDFTLVGNASQDLYWYDQGNRRKSRRRIIDSDQGKPAHGCKKCGLITIETSQASTPANKGRRLRRRGSE